MNVLFFNTYGGNKRKDRPEGGFYVEETDVSKTLDSSNGLNPSANQGGTLVLAYDPGVIGPLTATGMTRARGTETVESNHVLAFHPHYHDGARVQGDIINTITSRWGTGGNNMTMVVTWWDGSDTVPALTRNSENQRMPDKGQLSAMIIFSHTQGLDCQPSEVASPTLREGGEGMAIAFNPSGGTWDLGEQEEMPPTLRVGSGVGVPAPPAVSHGTIVRRLTPMECERLMGWPDNHTLHRADGKTNSDSTRYKMCGNGVATPVAHWIAQHLKGLINEPGLD